MSRTSAHSAHIVPDVCRDNGAIEDAESGHFVFDKTSDAASASKALGLPLPYEPRFEERECALYVGTHNRLIARMPWQEGDVSPGWRRKPKLWLRCLGKLSSDLPADLLESLDEHARCKVRDKKSEGFAICQKDKTWLGGVESNLVGCVLKANGFADVGTLLGHLVASPWKMVNRPFQPEYPGNREWNLGAAQYRYQPAEGDCKHWNLILTHVGQGLDDELAGHPWGKESGITTGAKYLMTWAACMLREPCLPLPYLFFYGQQNAGKSIYHEALALLMTKGVASADRALTSDFNGELANAVLAYIEEKDISKSPGAYNRIKDLVTSQTLWIRKMHTDLFEQANTLHFVQTANERDACPIFPGDSRITAVHVPDLEPGIEIPKRVLLERLREEAPQFMHKILNLELPELVGRLGLPCVDTSFKRQQIENNVHEFARAVGDYMEGHKSATLTTGEFVEAFGPGDWPRDIRRVRKVLEDSAAYLSGRGVSFQFPKRRTEKGYSVSLRRQ